MGRNTGSFTANSSAFAMLATAAWFLLLPMSGRASGQLTGWPEPAEWKDDATLNDVVFTSPTHGWVVGNQGTILHTGDGGLHWHPLSLDLSCRFESICFVSPNHGWIVGGYNIPLAAGSKAVVLRTVDGGRSWQNVPGLTIPRLRHVRFQSPTSGWAVGDGSPAYPSGIYYTEDGGKSWFGPARGDRKHWQTADSTGAGLVLAGRSGLAGVKNGDIIEESHFPESNPASLRQLIMVDSRFGFAVGSASALFFTKNGGLSWHPLDPPPQLRAVDLDWNTLCRRGDWLWLAGNPGSLVAKFNLQSHQWSLAPTPIRTAIEQLFFVDERRGWAVGDLGAIVSTNDGGATWSQQRGDAKDLAFLQVAGSAREISTEIFSMFAGEQNFIGGALLTGGEIPDSPAFCEPAQQACLRTGASVFQCLENASFRAGENSDALLRERLVLRLRTYRPRIIIVPRPSNARQQELASLVLDAVQSAASELEYQTQLSVLGLSSWRVSRVVWQGHGDRGGEQISPSQVMTHLACIVSDHVIPSRLLLGQAAFDSRSVTLTSVYADPESGDLSDQIFPGRGEVNRLPHRTRAGQSPGSLDLLKSLASKSRRMEGLETSAGAPKSAGQWRSEIAGLIEGLDTVSAGAWLFELADRYLRGGQPELAAWTHGLLVQNSQDHPLALASLRWLWRYYDSAEFAEQAIKSQPSIVQNRTAPSGASGVTRATTKIEGALATTTWEAVSPIPISADGRNPEPAKPDRGVEQVAATEPLEALVSRRDQQAKSVAQSLEVIDYGCSLTGRIAISRTLLARRLDSLAPIEAKLRQIANQFDSEAISSAALAELRLLQARADDTAPPVGVDRVRCSLGLQRAFLDGVLSDPVWQPDFAAEFPLTGAGESPAGRVLISGDQEFLFVAASLPKLEGVSYEPAAARKRDADLRRGDRLELVLDIDRDYESFYVFAVDARGRVAESCGGNLAWNPKWFVSSSELRDRWLIELAIPLDELFDGPPPPIMSWAVSVSRHLADQTIASWPQRAQVVHWESAHQKAVDGSLQQFGLPVSVFGYLDLLNSHSASGTDSQPDGGDGLNGR